MNSLVAQLALFVSTFTAFLVSAFYLVRFFERKTIPNISLSFSFLLFLISSLFAFFQGSPNSMSLPVASVAMVTLYMGLVLDRYSALKYTLPLPFIALFLFKAHVSFLVLSFLVYIAVLELAYQKEHTRLIPLVSAFTLVVVAGYFRVYGSVFQINSISETILYLLASLILLLWVTYYLMRKAIKLWRNQE